MVEDPGRQADLPSCASSARAEEMQKPELPWWLSGRGPACKAGDGGPIPGLGRSPEWQPLLYSCLENPIDRGAWQATAHEVAKVRHDWATEPPPSGPLEVLKAGPSVGGAAKAVGVGASRPGGRHCPVQAPPTRRCEPSADARSSAVCSKGSVSTV